VDVQEVPIVVLKFSPELHEMYGVWHCHDEAVLLLVLVGFWTIYKLENITFRKLDLLPSSGWGCFHYTEAHFDSG
jgi:hypothetical protein